MMVRRNVEVRRDEILRATCDEVAKHGFAVNVDNSLEPFGWIVPCGLPDVRMTSVALEAPGVGPYLPCFRKRMAWRFAEAHGARQRLMSLARVEAALEGATVTA